MLKIVCVVALICALAVQGEEMKRHVEECQEEFKGQKIDKMTMGKCVLRKDGIMTGDKTDYDKLVARINSSFTSESKKKIVLDAAKDCKDKHPDMSEDFMKCYGTVVNKECNPKM